MRKSRQYIGTGVAFGVYFAFSGPLLAEINGAWRFIGNVIILVVGACIVLGVPRLLFRMPNEG